MHEYDPWAPPEAANSYEHGLSPHEQRMWEVCGLYEQRYNDFVQLIESQRTQLVRQGRQAGIFGVDAGQLYESYAQMAACLPGQILQNINGSFEQVNLLLAQHGPDAALWAEVLEDAGKQHMLPYGLLQRASSCAVERAMRVGLDGFVWNRAVNTTGNPWLLERVTAEASSPALSRLMQRVLDERINAQLEYELNRPRLRQMIGGMVLSGLSPRSQQVARLGSAWTLHRAGKRFSMAAADMARGTIRWEPEAYRHVAGSVSDAEWLLARLPTGSARQLQRDPASLQWVVNSVRRLRAQAFLQGRVVEDHEILAGVKLACSQAGSTDDDDAHRAHSILMTLMQNNPYGRLPF